MFKPNSIRGLKELKNERELERISSAQKSRNSDDKNQSQMNKSAQNFTRESLNELLQENFDEISLVEAKIDEIRKWREQQKIAYEESIQKNKDFLKKDSKEFIEAQFDLDMQFQDYLNDLKTKQDEYNGYLVNLKVRQDQIEKEKEKQGIEIDNTTLKIQESYQKIEYLKDLENMMENAQTQLDSEKYQTRDKIIRDLKFNQNNQDQDDKQIDYLNKEVRDWEAQLDYLLQETAPPLPKKIEQKPGQKPKDQWEFRKELDDLDKEFADLEKLLNKKN